MFERLFALHSFFIVHGAGDIRLLFKLLLKFRNVLKHAERHACNQNIKDDIPTALEVFLCFETKRNDKNSPRKHSRNARVISAEELGTMSKNNLRGITLDIGPILGIHSLTLLKRAVEPRNIFVVYALVAFTHNSKEPSSREIFSYKVPGHYKKILPSQQPFRARVLL